MKIKAGKTYDTRGGGKITILTTTGNYPKLPVVGQLVTGGGVIHLNEEGKYPGNTTYDLIAPKATGYINVWPIEAEAVAHKKFAGQVTVPVEYEAQD